MPQVKFLPNADYCPDGAILEAKAGDKQKKQFFYRLRCGTKRPLQKLRKVVSEVWAMSKDNSNALDAIGKLSASMFV